MGQFTIRSPTSCYSCNASTIAASPGRMRSFLLSEVPLVKQMSEQVYSPRQTSTKIAVPAQSQQAHHTSPSYSFQSRLHRHGMRSRSPRLVDQQRFSKRTITPPLSQASARGTALL